MLGHKETEEKRRVQVVDRNGNSGNILSLGKISKRWRELGTMKKSWDLGIQVNGVVFYSLPKKSKRLIAELNTEKRKNLQTQKKRGWEIIFFLSFLGLEKAI